MLFFLLLYTPPVKSFDEILIDVEHISSQGWQFKEVSLSVFDLQKQTQQFALSIKQLQLPKPFTNIQLFNLHCLKFSWQKNSLECTQGEARLKSTWVESSTIEFTFSATDKRSHFTLRKLKFAQGTVDISANEEGQNWLVNIRSKGIKLQDLRALASQLDIGLDDLSHGRADLNAKLTGNNQGLNQFQIKSWFKNVSLQANQGRFATESLNFKIDLTAKRNKEGWQWKNDNLIKHGELYIDPVYLALKDERLGFRTEGLWLKQSGLQIQQASLDHPDVIALKTTGLIKLKKNLLIDKANISANIINLKKFSSQYISPFTDQTTFEGINLSGNLQAEILLEQSTIKQGFVDLKNLTVSDDKKRLAVENLSGVLYWSTDFKAARASTLHWKKIKIRAIPIDAGKISLLLTNNQITLLEQSSLHLLGGVLEVKQFKWQKSVNNEPKVFFQGGIKNISLEQLTTALDWTPLSGNISGYIPGVDYQNKTLTLKGGLKAQLFDGVIKINKLTSSGLFTNFQKMTMDMEIDNLDLHAITQKFQVGGMEGRLSGFINNLYLENWQPVTFYAWLGTPENDDSRHRISQKAVENIASIGSGGAANILSRGLLQFFDSFEYDRLGLGCYLHQGVCQLMGVEAADHGYYIVKGGGLVRIDVIGYNPQVDWKVLVKRLSRISTSDEIVIE